MPEKSDCKIVNFAEAKKKRTQSREDFLLKEVKENLDCNFLSSIRNKCRRNHGFTTSNKWRRVCEKGPSIAVAKD